MPSPEAPKDILDRLRQLERRLEAQEKGANLRNASISEGLLRLLGGEFRMEQGAIRIIGGILELLGGSGMVVGDDGEVRSDDFAAGVSGWRLGPTQAEFNDLVLRGGIIGNDALSNPVEVDTGAGNDIGFGVATTVATYGADTIPVPAGYTRAVVQAIATASVRNPTPDPDFLYVSAEIAGSGGAERPALAGGNGGYAMGVASAIRTLTGLSGGSISIGCRLRTNTAAWASNSGNSAGVDALVVFRR